MTPKQQEEFKDRAKKEAIDKIVGQQEIDEFKTKVQKETIDNIINRIEINDSYFYTKILVENAPIMDNPFGDKVKVYIKINLFDSKEFENENVINSNRKHLKANGIVSEIIIDKDDLINSKDTMRLVYKVISEEIAKTLFDKNRESINMILSQNKAYI